jgi:hypothetical protein
MLLGAETVTLKTYTGGSYVDGLWTGQTDSSLSISATVRPLTGDELQMLPEGQKNKNPHRFISYYPISLTDTIIASSIEFKIVKVKDNSRHGFLEHYTAIGLELRES